MTNILITNDAGDASVILRELKIPGTFSDTGGVQSAKIKKLEDGDCQIYASGGVLVFTNDGGATEEAIGAGGDGGSGTTIPFEETGVLANPPTLDQLHAVLGNAGTVGSGAVGVVFYNPSKGTDAMYWCVSDGSKWWYTAMTVAVSSE